MERLVSHFTKSIASKTLHTIGAEVETQFVDSRRHPISTAQSQQMLLYLSQRGWEIVCRKGALVTVLSDRYGNKIFYELGRHNIEVATAPARVENVVAVAGACLCQLYTSAQSIGVVPLFEPVLFGEEDLLVIPDERDANWLELDGRQALAPLARTSAVQFTFSVARDEAVAILNKLGGAINSFLKDYPQDRVWKEYIRTSYANYLSTRYGGPLRFESLENYCKSLAQHDFVQGARLVPLSMMANPDLSLYLRSIWWYFRLKRIKDTLCLEVRPIARRKDEDLHAQLDMVLSIVQG